MNSVNSNIHLSTFKFCRQKHIFFLKVNKIFLFIFSMSKRYVHILYLIVLDIARLVRVQKNQIKLLLLLGKTLHRLLCWCYSKIHICRKYYMYEMNECWWYIWNQRPLDPHWSCISFICFFVIYKGKCTEKRFFSNDFLKKAKRSMDLNVTWKG